MVLLIVAQIFFIGMAGGVLVVGVFGTFPFNRVVIISFTMLALPKLALKQL
jgi:hypothetical protein